MKEESAQQIFKRGSLTYYYSSLFFPKKTRQAVTTLYAFMRTADDYVDVIPPKKKEFENFVLLTKKAFRGDKTQSAIINDFYRLSQEYGFSQKWVFAFLKSMATDLNQKKYSTFSELEKYIYGSAEVIGLFMAKIINLPPKAYPYARLLGKAMQLVNFIRDFEEDLALKRIYLPQAELQKWRLNNFPPKKAQEIRCFENIIRLEIKRYLKIHKKAEKGYRFIPKKYLLPVKTAADLYRWTALKIYKKPMIVFERKVKPKKSLVVLSYLKNLFSL